jgi:hypothetical protein
MHYWRGGRRRLALALFANPAAADAAARRLQRRRLVGTRNDAVGILTRGLRGPLQLRLRSGRRIGGPALDAVLGVISRDLADTVPPPRGSLFGGDSDLSTDDLARFAVELEDGQALVAVLGRRRAAGRAALALIGQGGRAELHWISDRAVRRAAAQPGAPVGAPSGGMDPSGAGRWSLSAGVPGS